MTNLDEVLLLLLWTSGWCGALVIVGYPVEWLIKRGWM